jgi:hypothetical protein
MMTSPDKMVSISSRSYLQQKRPLVHDQTITIIAPSSLRAISLARACGLPSMTHPSGNGTKSNSMVAGLAATVGPSIQGSK